MPSITTICISHNEEANIERCLRSVASFSDEIILVDSLSTDRTVELARPLATKVISHEWLGYGKQKQFGLEQCSGDWVFSIDADEEVSPELAAEIRSLDYTHDGYWMPRPVWYLGRWIRHSGWYPGYILRLFRRERGRFTDDRIHEYVQVEGRTKRLRGDLCHYSYRDVAHHVDKMNEFTSLAAQQMFERGRRPRIWQLTLVISTLHSYYVFLKYAKLWELCSGGRSAEDRR